MQLEKVLTIDDIALLQNKEIRIYQKIGMLTAFLCGKREDDCPIIISGDRGNGKSHVMGNLARYHAKYMNLINHKQIDMENWLKTKICYDKEKNVTTELYERENDIIGVDEGYFSGLNQRAMYSEVINLAEALNASRSNGNLSLWCFSWPYRATKPILESAKIWIHKYDLDHGYLYIQPRFWKGDDPFYIKEISQAKRINKTKYAMTYVDSFITDFATVPMPPGLEAQYKEYKAQSRKKMAKQSKIFKKIEETEMGEFEEIIDKQKGGKMGISDAELESYFKKKGYSRRSTTNKIIKFWEFYDIKPETA